MPYILSVVVITQLCTFSQTHQTLHLKWDNFTVCKPWLIKLLKMYTCGEGIKIVEGFVCRAV